MSYTATRYGQGPQPGITVHPPHLFLRQMGIGISFKKVKLFY